MKTYLKNGAIIGAVGYTDLKLTSKGFVLESTEGAEYDFYDSDEDQHYPVKIDMEGTPETNKNFGKYFYEKE